MRYDLDFFKYREIAYILEFARERKDTYDLYFYGIPMYEITKFIYKCYEINNNESYKNKISQWLERGLKIDPSTVINMSENALHKSIYNRYKSLERKNQTIVLEKRKYLDSLTELRQISNKNLEFIKEIKYIKDRKNLSAQSTELARAMNRYLDTTSVQSHIKYLKSFDRPRNEIDKFDYLISLSYSMEAEMALTLYKLLSTDDYDVSIKHKKSLENIQYNLSIVDNILGEIGDYDLFRHKFFSGEKFELDLKRIKFKPIDKFEDEVNVEKSRLQERELMNELSKSLANSLEISLKDLVKITDKKLESDLNEFKLNKTYGVVSGRNEFTKNETYNIDDMTNESNTNKINTYDFITKEFNKIHQVNNELGSEFYIDRVNHINLSLYGGEVKLQRGKRVDGDSKEIVNLRLKTSEFDDNLRMFNDNDEEITFLSSKGQELVVLSNNDKAMEVDLSGVTKGKIINLEFSGEEVEKYVNRYLEKTYEKEFDDKDDYDNNLSSDNVEINKNTSVKNIEMKDSTEINLFNRKAAETSDKEFDEDLDTISLDFSNIEMLLPTVTKYVENSVKDMLIDKKTNLEKNQDLNELDDYDGKHLNKQTLSTFVSDSRANVEANNSNEITNYKNASLNKSEEILDEKEYDGNLSLGVKETKVYSPIEYDLVNKVDINTLNPTTLVDKKDRELEDEDLHDLNISSKKVEVSLIDSGVRVEKHNIQKEFMDSDEGLNLKSNSNELKSFTNNTLVTKVLTKEGDSINTLALVDKVDKALDEIEVNNISEIREMASSPVETIVKNNITLLEKRDKSLEEDVIENINLSIGSNLELDSTSKISLVDKQDKQLEEVETDLNISHTSKNISSIDGIIGVVKKDKELDDIIEDNNLSSGSNQISSLNQIVGVENKSKNIYSDNHIKNIDKKDKELIEGDYDDSYSTGKMVDSDVLEITSYNLNTDLSIKQLDLVKDNSLTSVEKNDKDFGESSESKEMSKNIIDTSVFANQNHLERTTEELNKNTSLADLASSLNEVSVNKSSKNGEYIEELNAVKTSKYVEGYRNEINTISANKAVDDIDEFYISDNTTSLETGVNNITVFNSKAVELGEDEVDALDEGVSLEVGINEMSVNTFSLVDEEEEFDSLDFNMSVEANSNSISVNKPKAIEEVADEFDDMSLETLERSGNEVDTYNYKPLEEVPDEVDDLDVNEFIENKSKSISITRPINHLEKGKVEVGVIKPVIDVEQGIIETKIINNLGILENKKKEIEKIKTILTLGFIGKGLNIFKEKDLDKDRNEVTIDNYIKSGSLREIEKSNFIQDKTFTRKSTNTDVAKGKEVEYSIEIEVEREKSLDNLPEDINVNKPITTDEVVDEFDVIEGIEVETDLIEINIINSIKSSLEEELDEVDAFDDINYFLESGLNELFINKVGNLVEEGVDEFLDYGYDHAGLGLENAGGELTKVIQKILTEELSDEVTEDASYSDLEVSGNEFFKISSKTFLEESEDEVEIIDIDENLEQTVNELNIIKPDKNLDGMRFGTKVFKNNKHLDKQKKEVSIAEQNKTVNNSPKEILKHNGERVNFRNRWNFFVGDAFDRIFLTTSLTQMGEAVNLRENCIKDITIGGSSLTKIIFEDDDTEEVSGEEIHQRLNFYLASITTPADYATEMDILVGEYVKKQIKKNRSYFLLNFKQKIEDAVTLYTFNRIEPLRELPLVNPIVEAKISLSAMVNFFLFYEQIIYVNKNWLSYINPQEGMDLILKLLRGWILEDDGIYVPMGEEEPENLVPIDYVYLLRWYEWYANAELSFNGRNYERTAYQSLMNIRDQMVNYFNEHWGIRSVKYGPDGMYVYSEELSLVNKIRGIKHNDTQAGWQYDTKQIKSEYGIDLLDLIYNLKEEQ